MPAYPKDNGDGGSGGGTSGGGIGEAPKDGKLYGRKDGSWSAVQEGGVEHNQLGGLQGGDPSKSEFYHLSKSQADGAVHANEPSATNPYLTEADLPYLDKRVTEFTRVKMPPLEQLYGVVFGQERFVAVGDDVCVVSPDGMFWYEIHVPSGFWRSVVYGAGMFVAVGLDGKVMFSSDGDTWTEVTGPPGDWNALAFGNGTFVAVGDKQIMTSVTGTSQWVAKTAPAGYARAVTFGNGVFTVFGTSGAMTSVDGAAWEPRDVPKATWRAVTYGDGKVIALGGRCAISEDDGTTWVLDEKPPIGGWDAAIYGGGFFVAVGGYDTCMVSPSGVLNWELRDVPNFIWHALAFGKDTFVAVGSAIMYAKIVDVAAALNNAHAPNGTNVFVTMDDLKEMKAAIRVLYAVLTWNGEPGELSSWADVMGVNKDMLAELLNDILKWKAGD